MAPLRARHTWGAGVLVAAAGLLALVAVAAEGSPLKAPLDKGSGDLSRLVSVAQILALAAAVLFLVMLIASLTGERRRPVQFKARHSIVRTLLITAVLALISLSIAPLRRDTRDDKGQTGPAQTQPAEPRPADDDGGSGLGVMLIGLGVAAAFGYAVWRSRAAPPLPDEGTAVAVRQAAVDLFDASLDDLEAEPDPRRAIIAAYARLLDGLDRCSLGRAIGEAPEEHLARALRSLAVRRGPMQRLVALFAEARFSEHELTAAHKAAAIEAFRAARDDLGRHLAPA
jgi:hypothetical protein